jgi:hypothetical protein
MTLRFMIAVVVVALATPVPVAYAASEAPDTAASVTFAPKADFDKFSGNVRFVGGVDHAIYNRDKTARIAFSKLQNQHATQSTGDLSVILFLTASPIAPGDTFSGWFVAAWVAPDKLAPGESFVNVNVTRPLLVQVPDGVYYVNLGSFEVGPACGSGLEYCYDDIRVFPDRVQVYHGSYYVYTGPPQPGAHSMAVEFFHPAMGHYFVSADADEIAGLDSGAIAGWTRTGQGFDVWTTGTGLADVCRFFTTFFAPQSSHYYTAIAVECEVLKLGEVWQYEKLAFKVALPSPDGRCLVGIPLYRLYNDGRTGAPNHRYTTSLAIRSEMISQGFVPEDADTVCVAAPGGP